MDSFKRYARAAFNVLFAVYLAGCVIGLFGWLTFAAFAMQSAILAPLVGVTAVVAIASGAAVYMVAIDSL